jgi:hypothetical protein
VVKVDLIIKLVRDQLVKNHFLVKQRENLNYLDQVVAKIKFLSN